MSIGTLVRNFGDELWGHTIALLIDLTTEQIKDAFKKWVRPADFVQVTLGPVAQEL